MKRVAIYARVSSKDKGQDVWQQLPDLHRYIEQIGAVLVAEYVEEERGDTHQRPHFQALLLAAYQRRFDLVLFWSLDRFSQEGPRATLNHLYTLQTYNIRFLSLTEPSLEIDTPMGEAMVALVAAQAAQFLVATSASIKRALVLKKEKGVVLGRPRQVDDELADKIRELAAAGLSHRKIAAEVGLKSHRAIARYLVPATTG